MTERTPRKVRHLVSSIIHCNKKALGASDRAVTGHRSQTHTRSHIRVGCHLTSPLPHHAFLLLHDSCSPYLTSLSLSFSSPSLFFFLRLPLPVRGCDRLLFTSVLSPDPTGEPDSEAFHRGKALTMRRMMRMMSPCDGEGRSFSARWSDEHSAHDISAR